MNALRISFVVTILFYLRVIRSDCDGKQYNPIAKEGMALNDKMSTKDVVQWLANNGFAEDIQNCFDSKHACIAKLQYS